VRFGQRPRGRTAARGRVRRRARGAVCARSQRRGARSRAGRPLSPHPAVSSGASGLGLPDRPPRRRASTLTTTASSSSLSASRRPARARSPAPSVEGGGGSRRRAWPWRSSHASRRRAPSHLLAPPATPRAPGSRLASPRGHPCSPAALLCSFPSPSPGAQARPLLPAHGPHTTLADGGHPASELVPLG